MKNILNTRAKENNKSRKRQHEPAFITTICWRSGVQKRTGKVCAMKSRRTTNDILCTKTSKYNLQEKPMPQDTYTQDYEVTSTPFLLINFNCILHCCSPLQPFKDCCYRSRVPHFHQAAKF